MALDDLKKPAPDAEQSAPEAEKPASKQEPQADGKETESEDPALARIQSAIREKLPANLRVPVEKVYVAGMKVMFDPSTHQLMLKELNNDIDPGTAVGKGIASLITLLWRQSKGTLPIPAIPPAAVLLVCSALDFMEQTKMAEVTPQVIDTAVKTVIGLLMQKVGLTPDKMAQIAGRAPGGAQPGQPPAAPQGGPQPSALQGGLVNSQMGAAQ